MAHRIAGVFVLFFVIGSLALPPATQSQPDGESNHRESAGESTTAERLILDEQSFIPDDASHPGFVTSARRLLVPPELKEAPEEWIENSLAWCDFIFNSMPPAIPEYPARRAALQRLDDILHIQSAPDDPVVRQFYIHRIEHAIEEIRTTRVTSGMRIWKLYNHGFFVKTATVSFCFDLVPGAPETSFQIPHNLVRQLAELSDAMFISHWHPDHANKGVAAEFLALNKPVIAPPGLWSDDPSFSGRLTYANRDPLHIQKIAVTRSERTILVRTFPGHQGPPIENDLYLVTTPEGFTVMHLGDQFSSPDDHSEDAIFKDFARKYHVDVLLPNAWNPRLLQTITSVNPALVIPGHENELAHAVPHREDYVQSYERLTGCKTPWLIMAWGEGYSFHPENRLMLRSIRQKQD
ncbi:MBL fold metallo-hydrolase [Paracidobacterium acidisoli]|uniref:MBL fold metallo-hydrolase n=1 Tax=Paracidobacterium acidisoli TaxID=2303751 RepID=UPI0011C19EC4|nr:MBL fold metallo-hydrolase [Paracidobacterium acidisoli]MBT9333131.1 MBL fold metallo-hydrolase [Paracidobacterium acidisoli]